MTDLPNIARDLLILAVPIIAVLLIRTILIRSLPDRDTRESERILPFMIRTIAVFFGIIAGLALSSGTARVEYLRETTAREIHGLTMLGLISSQLPEPVAAEAMAGIETYIGEVTTSELPALADGRLDLAAGVALVRLWATFADFVPGDEVEAELRAMALEQLNVIGEQRQVRVSGGIRLRSPGTWGILIAGSLIVVLGATLASLRYHRVATLFLGAITGTITLVLLAIYSTEHPFQYGLSGEREFYDSFLESFHQVQDSLSAGTDSPQP